MSVQTKLLTVDEFLHLYPGDEPYELLEGEVIQVPPPKWKHGNAQRRIAARLGDFVDAHQLGDVATEVGFQVSESSLIAPDVAFISAARLAIVADSDEYFPFAPDLAVEIVSPSNSATDIQQKVNLYLAAGTRLVWVVYPKLKQVIVHAKSGARPPISVDGILDGGDVLLGLAIPVSSIFPAEAAAQEE